MSWIFIDNQRSHTQDGCQLALLIKEQRKRKSLRVIDVGCGDGIIISEMIRLNRGSKFVGIDISSHAIKAAQKNLSDDLEKKTVSLHKVSAVSFFKRRHEWDSYERFVINPPFFKWGAGQINKKKLDQIARHEGALSLKVWAMGAKRLLRSGGELYCVLPTERLSECFVQLSRNKLEPKELWWLKEDKRKRRFFLRAVRGGKPGLKVNF